MAHNTRTTEKVRNGDAILETFVEGEGPALVVLPSYGRDGGEDFDPFAKLVADAGFTVLRPQPRGVAGSTGDMKASLADMSDDIAAVVKQLGGGTAVVLGHAFGNGVARLLATSHQDVVKGTVLAAAGGKSASDETQHSPFVAGDLSLPEETRLAALTKNFFAPHHDARIWLSGWYPATLHMQKKAVEAVNPQSFSGAGAAPILQIIAESDPFNPYASWRELREQCGDRVSTQIIANASHALFPEQAQEVALQVVAWMRQQAW